MLRSVCLFLKHDYDIHKHTLESRLPRSDVHERKVHFLYDSAKDRTSTSKRAHILKLTEVMALEKALAITT